MGRKKIVVSFNYKGLKLVNTGRICCLCGTPFDGETGFCSGGHGKGKTFILVNRNNKIEKICIC